MATVRENIKNALNWFYDRLKDKYIDPFNERITTNTNDIATNTADIATNTANIEKNTTDISQLNSDLTSDINRILFQTSSFSGDIDELITDTSFGNNSGLYWINSDISGEHPTSGYYHLLVLGHLQMAFAYSSSNRYAFYRQYVNSVWNSWVQL